MTKGDTRSFDLQFFFFGGGGGVWGGVTSLVAPPCLEVRVHYNLLVVVLSLYTPKAYGTSG